jgi:hypothetical protein
MSPRTVVHNDAAATAERVLGHETLYRWGMLAETLSAVIFIGLSLALYRLFEDVDRHRARQLVATVLVPVPSEASIRRIMKRTWWIPFILCLVLAPFSAPAADL